jgi:S1/P1 Nuclease
MNKTLVVALGLSCTYATQAFAWGQEGHSIVAEIAQRRLSPEAAATVEQLLGRGHSLASIASWADDVRDDRPETYNWHFVDIPIKRDDYQPALDCKSTDKGDCAVAELERLRNDLPCATGAKKAEALKFAVHFVGDIHQPLHTVLENIGGNTIQVDLFARGLTCTGHCQPSHMQTNFHAAWDTGLVEHTVFDWGAYVERLETGWLLSGEAHTPGIDGGTPAEWVVETHKSAQTVWNELPADHVLGDNYYQQILPVLDRQLGVAGLRLAKFLNDAYAPHACPPK